MAYEWSRGLALLLGATDVGASSSTPNLDANFVFETSGDVWWVRFSAPVGQSAATITVYVYVTGVTGTPDFQLEVRSGYSGTGDVDRPATGGSNLATSPSTLTLGAGDIQTWVALTATVSLTEGNGYYVIVKNTHNTPASNHATFALRSLLDTYASTGLYPVTGYSLDGFATDPTTSPNSGVVVVKFADGTLLGNPYVSSSNHANNANDRGNRITLNADVVVSGIVRGTSSAALSASTIYTTAGVSVVSAAGDAFAKQGSAGSYRFAPTKLSGGTTYDFVHKFASSTTACTVLSMGEVEADVPADVLACRPWSIAFVDGATPGSYTVDTSKLVALMALIVDDFPAGPIGRSLIAGRGSPY